MWRFCKKWWPFTVLCLASISRAILSENFPVVIPTIATLAVATLLTTLSFAAFFAVKGCDSPKSAVQVTWAAFAGMLLIGGPTCELLFRPHDVVETDILFVGSLIPVVISIASAARAEGSLSTRGLWPGIAASAALLLMFPEPRVRSLAGILTLVLLPVSTGLGAALLFHEAPSECAWRLIPAPLGACPLFFAVMFLRHGEVSRFTWQACVLDSVIIGSTLLTGRRVGALRYAAFFVLMPFCLGLYGIVIFRPGLNVRIALGLAALLASCLTLLLAPPLESRDRPFQLMP